jgi:hypothetical protein
MEVISWYEICNVILPLLHANAFPIPCRIVLLSAHSLYLLAVVWLLHP